MSKTEVFNRTLRDVPTSILNADREEHSKFRRALSHGFSDSAMRQQEAMIVKYIDLLLKVSSLVGRPPCTRDLHLTTYVLACPANKKN